MAAALVARLACLLVVAAIAGCGPSSSEDSATSGLPAADAHASMPTVPTEHEAGMQVYQQKCSLCHDHGEAGSPRLGNPRQWPKRAEKGLEQLTKNAVEGFEGDWGEMPPQGDDLSPEQVESAVKYMLYRFEIASKTEP